LALAALARRLGDSAKGRDARTTIIVP
jgi:hypothetical protein